jgi:dTDP-4-dehydrorhamnose reductase
MRILITGANGQLGQELNQLSDIYPGFEFIFYNKNQWDIGNFEQSESIIHEMHADVLINTAAYTKVDLAEDEQDLCYKLNALAPKYLARYCRNSQTKFIHISTDYVFNADTNISLTEDVKKNPIGVYATSKSIGEDEAIHENSESIIIRTSWLYSSFGHNFVKTMYKLSQTHKAIKVVSDQTGNPTYAKNLAEGIIQMITWMSSHIDARISGVYHFSNLGSCTWYQFAQEIFNYIQADVNLINITTKEYGAKAHRPLYSSLDCSKIQKTFNIVIPNWKSSLHECLDLIRNDEIKQHK